MLTLRNKKIKYKKKKRETTINFSNEASDG